MNERVAVAILARAPIPGRAKTRLIPVLGPEGAARLQERFIVSTVAKAVAADIGSITLWCTPTTDYPVFQTCWTRGEVSLATQPDGDLGVRMFAALSHTTGPALVIGTDCPALTPDHLRRCADALRRGVDAVFLPTEDGGYVLAGMTRPHESLFEDMMWSTESVMAETRRRVGSLGWRWEEPETLWDVDEPADLARVSDALFDPVLAQITTPSSRLSSVPGRPGEAQQKVLDEE